MKLDKANQRIFVRQSWLNDAVTCGERSRLGMVKPEMRTGSDATIMGTAVHYAIELVLTGTIATYEMEDAAIAQFKELKATEQWQPTNIDSDKYEVYIRSMCQSFLDGIFPEVELGGTCEMRFQYPMGFTAYDWAVWAEGTMDYVSPSGVVWDWKTASRAYNAKEKQSQSIQASVYAGAVHHLGLSDLPVDFRYGVMIRQEKPRSQIVRLSRGSSHLRWLEHTIKPVLSTGLLVGVDNSWPMNDSSNLCSEKWCSYWSICKGAFLTEQDLSPVTVPVDIS